MTAMTDLRDRFHRADRLQPPNLWPEVMQRASSAPERSLPWTPSTFRLGFLLLALVLLASVAIAAIGALLRKPVPTPPELGFIAYSVDAGRSGTGDIYLTSLNGTPRPFIGTKGDGLDQACPSFSPDGSLLAYGEHEEDPEGADGPRITFNPGAVVIVALDQDGVPSPRRRIPAGEVERVPCPIWSPDGRAVAFLAEGNSVQVVSVDGPSAKFAVDGAGTDIAWTHDSSAVVVLVRARIEIVPTDGTERLLLPESQRSDGLTEWFEFVAASPVGPELAIVGRWVAGPGADSPGEGFTRLVDYRDGRVIFEEARAYGRPAWSPEGTRLAWRSQPGISVQTIGEPSATELGARWVMEGERNAVNALFAISAVVWSPDGARLLFVARTGGGGCAYGCFAFVSIAAAGPADLLVLSPLTSDLGWADQRDVTWQAISGG